MWNKHVKQRKTKKITVIRKNKVHHIKPKGEREPSVARKKKNIPNHMKKLINKLLQEKEKKKKSSSQLLCNS